jgi:hypothetical protein
MTTLAPLPPERRHPADYRDDIEHAEVAAILSELSDGHPARAAYSSGAREASDSIQLSHLLTERMDLVDRLTKAYFEHQGRIWDRYTGTGNVQTRCAPK